MPAGWKQPLTLVALYLFMDSGRCGVSRMIELVPGGEPACGMGSGSTVAAAALLALAHAPSQLPSRDSWLQDLFHAQYPRALAIGNGGCCVALGLTPGALFTWGL